MSDKQLFECYATLMSSHPEHYQTGGGGLGRAAIGGILFGGAGAVVGAVTAKSKTDTRQVDKRDGYGKLFLFNDRIEFATEDGHAILPIINVYRITASSDEIKPFISQSTLRDITDEKMHHSLQKFSDEKCFFRVDRRDRKEFNKLVKQIQKKMKDMRKDYIKDLKSQKVGMLARRKELAKRPLVEAWSKIQVV